MSPEINIDFLKGIIEGEGCFCISISKINSKEYLYPTFTINLSVQDKLLLEKIYSFIKLGKIFYNNKYCSLKIYNIKDCLSLIMLLGPTPFIGKKQNEYEQWNKTVNLKHNKEHLKDMSVIYSYRNTKLKNKGRLLKYGT